CSRAVSARDGAHHARPDSALSRFEIRLNRVERGILHDHDHDRRREHWRQRRVLELIGEMLGPYDQFEPALRADRYLFHELLRVLFERRRPLAYPRCAAAPAPPPRSLPAPISEPRRRVRGRSARTG